MPKNSPHPYVSWRNGRPRFKPSPELRAAGHRDVDLKTETGAWFTRGQCVDWSNAFTAQLPKIEKRKAAPPRRPPSLTVGKMVALWQEKSSRWQDGPRQMAVKTMRDYRQKLRVIEQDHYELWSAAAADVEPHHMQGVYDEIERDRGLGTARGAVVVLGIAFKWAIRRGHLRNRINPCTGVEKHMPAPRVRFGTPAQMRSLIAAADALAMPYVGDCIVLGLWTGQRQADRLALKLHGRIGKRRHFKQAKTGAIVQVKEAPELEQRLAAAQARRIKAGKVSPFIILNEREWIPYAADTFRHDFAKVRAAAVNGIIDAEATAALPAGINTPVWIVEPCPALADFHDQDLRDTAVTWMALAGATIPEIASVTGHSLETVHTVLKHYLARHPDMADAAINKTVAWYELGGDLEGEG